jgi:hypothetical protein
VSDVHKGDYDYFSVIHEEMKNGGTAALMAYLLKWDITGWHPRDIPETLKQQGWELKIRSGGTIIQWWFDMLENGWLEKRLIYNDEAQLLWPEKMLCDDVKKSYLDWCYSYRITHIEHSVALGMQLKEFGVERTRLRHTDSELRYFYILPALEFAQTIFSKELSLPISVFWDKSM